MIYFIILFSSFFYLMLLCPRETRPETEWQIKVISFQHHFIITISMYNAILNFHFLLSPLKLTINNILHPLVFLYFFIPSCRVSWDLRCVFVFIFWIFTPSRYYKYKYYISFLILQFFVLTCCVLWNTPWQIM